MSFLKAPTEEAQPASKKAEGLASKMAGNRLYSRDARSAAIAAQRKTPAGSADRGKHVDEERRAVLRSVAPQRPCL